MTKSKLLVLGALFSTATIGLMPGCGDDTSETSGGAGAGNTTTSSPGSGAASSSSTTGASNGGGGSGATGGTGGGAPQTCADYCKTAGDNCKDANDQWGESVPMQCEETCALWAPGTAADTTGNTLGCHIYHAGAAMMDPGLHCIHAGPAGGGMMFCGGECDNFCELADKACAGKFATPMECKMACMGWAKMPVYSAATTMGDTFACRLYHLTAAAADPAGHCDHIVDQSVACN